MNKFLLIFPILFLFYGFQFEDLGSFFPSKNLKEIEEKYGKGELLNQKGSLKILKYKVRKDNYQVDVILQSDNDNILEFFCHFPSYFLHDPLHQALINRFGKQDIYQKIEEQALYIWKNVQGIRLVYYSSCTITCFPIYLTGTINPIPEEVKGNFEPLLESMMK